jgi:hypothetical protein
MPTKLLTGHTGYDIVVPGSSFMACRSRLGEFRKLVR